ncbi:MAG: aminotransferase class III-fold pyridoxal phosphate-dependent enzyme, partial [Sandarakinorhabdus sp.]|nr:aminotransferase class III-fold pyridoxal phosphate-dependent enzyme [Sandarakinorhabdus sp.]
KGITNAAVPMGAVACHRTIYDTITNAATGIELFHGYTYSAHPLACAAALATLDLYRDEALFDRARALEPHWQAAVHSLAGAPHVIDIRNFGLVAGIELAPRPEAPGARGQALFRMLFDAGLLVRATGDIIALSPPLIVEAAQIDSMMAMIGTALRTLA